MTNSLTTYLTEIKQRLEKATPGPWIVQRCNDASLVTEAHGADVTGWLKDYPFAYIAKIGGWGYSLNYKNGELIANAPSDLARLVRVVECLMEGLEQYEGHPDVVQPSGIKRIDANTITTEGSATIWPISRIAREALEKAQRIVAEGGE